MNCTWFWFLLIKTEDIYLEGIRINRKTSALKGIISQVYLDSNGWLSVLSLGLREDLISYAF